MQMDKNDKLQEINTTMSDESNKYFSDVFTPGETKEQLEIGKQVKGSTGGGKFWIQEYEHTTGVGSFSFTGA